MGKATYYEKNCRNYLEWLWYIICNLQIRWISVYGQMQIACKENMRYA